MEKEWKKTLFFRDIILMAKAGYRKRTCISRSFSVIAGGETLNNEENNFPILTPKELKFCEAYFDSGEKGKAAEIAGYKNPSVAASRLLKKDSVLAHIHAIQKNAREELHIDDNWAVLRAIEVYNRCMQAVPVMEWDYSEHKMMPTGEYAFDSKGALKALELIKNLLGLGEEDKTTLQKAIMFIDELGG